MIRGNGEEEFSMDVLQTRRRFFLGLSSLCFLHMLVVSVSAQPPNFATAGDGCLINASSNPIYPIIHGEGGAPTRWAIPSQSRLALQKYRHYKITLMNDTFSVDVSRSEPMIAGSLSVWSCRYFYVTIEGGRLVLREGLPSSWVDTFVQRFRTGIQSLTEFVDKGQADTAAWN